MLASANLFVLCSLIFTCGCQNESAATKRVEPPRALYVEPPQARALNVEDEIALDKLASEELGPVDGIDTRQVNWEEDVTEEGPPELGAILNFESTDPSKLGDTSETDAFLKKASKR